MICVYTANNTRPCLVVCLLPCTDVANAFQISHANKSFHVFGQSAADKANWIANLQKHISRVAKTCESSISIIIIITCLLFLYNKMYVHVHSTSVLNNYMPRCIL